MSILTRTIFIGAAAGAYSYHHASSQNSASRAATAAAQLPAHYKVSEHSPATVSADGRPITVRVTVSFVTVAARDSAGGSIWELAVDSASSTIIPRDSTDARARRGQLGPIAVLSPTSYRAYVRDRRVIRTEVDRRATFDFFAIENPAWSLLTQLPPFASLPRRELPIRVGESRVDTSASRRLLPSGFWYDTMVVQWGRTPTGAVDGALTHHLQFVGRPARRSDSDGSVHIVLAADGSVVEARIEERSIRRQASGIVIGADTHVTAVALIKGS